MLALALALAATCAAALLSGWLLGRYDPPSADGNEPPTG
jgi:hypothetical protein